MPVAPYTGTHNVSSFGAACAQQAVPPLSPPISSPPAVTGFLAALSQPLANQSEDCLFINVVQPAGVDPQKTKLPVAVWIYGDGFDDGDTSQYDGRVTVNRSIELGEPVIYVSMNYRVNGIHSVFLPGLQVKEAGNDWAFDGSKSTLMLLEEILKRLLFLSGRVSAGAISVALQILANGGNTEGLFRGAFMQSGSPTPVGDITHGQQYYDMLVQNAGCEDSPDSLDCLRGVPYETLLDAINMSPAIFSYQALNLAWQPRTDGRFLAANFQQLVLSGSVAPIPFVTGDCDDEGTLFSLSSLNITTDDEFRDYISDNYLTGNPSSDIDRILELYPSNATQGSPFDTGAANALTPQFKRLSAFQVNFIFQGPRRFFLSQLAEKTNAWSYLNKRLKSTPGLGFFHASDIANVFGPGDLTDFLVNFVNHLDPNGQGGIFWPKYNTKRRMLMTLVDGNVSQTLSTDTYREAPLAFVTQVALAHPL